MPVLSPLMVVMTRAAEKVGRVLCRDFGEVEQLQVSLKGPGDFVTSSDIRADEMLRAELKKARPDFGFLTEEGAEQVGKQANTRWIIDPIDGTSNFLHGIPHWCISIAVERENEIVAGLVYDPLNNQPFWAEKGMGAFLGNLRLRLSARRNLKDCLILAGIPAIRGLEHKEKALQQLANLMPKVATISRLGSAALGLAYIAAGRGDGFFETGLKPWDIAAGMLLVREAGGIVTEQTGGAEPLYSSTIVAANKNIHKDLLELLNIHKS